MRANTYSVLYNAGDCEAPHWKTYVKDVDMATGYREVLACAEQYKSAAVELHCHVVNSNISFTRLTYAYGEPINKLFTSLADSVERASDELFSLRAAVNATMREKVDGAEPFGTNEKYIYQTILNFPL